MVPTSLTFTTANICGNPLRVKPAVRRRMRQALDQSGAVFGQEVARSNAWHGAKGALNYNTLWRLVAIRHGKLTSGGGREVPISTPRAWKVLSSASHLVHTGRKRVSPNRYITEVRCVVDGHHVALLNCHPVSKPRRGVPASAWRIARWNAYHAKLVELVAAAHEAGFTVVFGGDMNKTDVPKVHPAQQVLIERGLDHLWLVPAEGDRVRVTHRAKVARTPLMDHPILTATIELS